MFTPRFASAVWAAGVCAWVFVSTDASADQRFCMQKEDNVVITTGTADKPLKTIRKKVDPALSPDGTAVAVTQNDNEPNRSIWIEPLDGKPRVKVDTGHSVNAYGAFWSADGARLAFNAFDGHHWSVGVADSHGANFQSLTAKLPGDKDYFLAGWNYKTGEPLVSDLETLFQVSPDGGVSWKKSVVELLGPVETSPYSVASDSRAYITPDGTQLILNVLDEKGDGEDGPPACVLLVDTKAWTLKRAAKDVPDPHDVWMSFDGKFLLMTGMNPKSKNPVPSVYRWDLEKNVSARLFRSASSPTASD